jgi:hypothetical protein
MGDDSCLNGWGFGNLAASAHDLASFYFQYFGTEKIIKHETAAKMMHFDEQQIIQRFIWSRHYANVL